VVPARRRRPRLAVIPGPLWLWSRAKAILDAGAPATTHATDYAQHLVIRDGDDVLDSRSDGPFTEPQAEALQRELGRHLH
jgi:hypothetical protein